LRAAALRGLKGALCERLDFASGTTSRSSRLIHGGLRYLEHGHLRLVRESLAERRILLDIAPHLVEPLPIHLPIYRDGQRRAWKVALGLRLYDLLAGRNRLGPSRMLEPKVLPGLRAEGLEALGVVVDARLPSPERLVIETLVDAERMGAVAVNHLELASLEESGRGLKAELTDRASGGRIGVEAGAVVNAAGPWVGEVEQRAGTREARVLRGTRGTHLLFPRFDGAPERALLVEARRDGRPFFILPADGGLLVGTTEVAHEGDAGEAVATAAEIDYLRSELESVWPAARGVLPYAAYAGVRPLPSGGARIAAASRRHRLEPASRGGGPRGVFSLVGGKLTTHRLEGEEAARAVAVMLGRGDRGEAEPTRKRPLPGAQCDPEPTLVPGALAERFALPVAEASRLLRRWGARAWAVAAGFGDESPVAGAGGLHPAEIRFAIEHEGAFGLDDVLYRRTGSWESPVLTGDGVRAAAAAWASARQTLEKRAVDAAAIETKAEAEAARVIALLKRHHGRTL
jgi:glycerol-3-phosphate dehydrogenase